MVHAEANNNAATHEEHGTAGFGGVPAT